MSSWSAVVQRANSDSQFRERLKADPASACRDAGCQVPAGAAIDVVEDREDELHIFLGTRPQTPELRQLVDRAGQDTAFKSRLLADPRRGFEEATGETVPAHIKVRVHEQSPGRTVLVLSRPDCRQELSDAELATVAGGTLKGLIKRVGNGIRDLLCRDTQIDISGGNTNNTTGMITEVDVVFDTSPGTETKTFTSAT